MPQASLSEKHQIAPAIVTLLGLYWQSDESPETRRLIADAWLDSLLQFEAAIVIESCREWWENHTKRPVLAEIVKLCRENRSIAEEKAKIVLPPPEGVPAWFSSDRDLVRSWSEPEDDGDLRLAYQRRRDALAAQQAKHMPPEQMQRDGRAVCDQWARQQGYADFAAAERAGHDHDEVSRWIVANTSPKHILLIAGEEISATESERRRRDTLLDAKSECETAIAEEAA